MKLLYLTNESTKVAKHFQLIWQGLAYTLKERADILAFIRCEEIEGRNFSLVSVVLEEKIM